MLTAETSGIDLRTQEVIMELTVLLGQQLRLETNTKGEKIDISEDHSGGVTLVFHEEGRRYELVVSQGFVQLYPWSLSQDVKKALSYLGEYLRCTDKGRLLLTEKHAYERWSSDTTA